MVTILDKRPRHPEKAHKPDTPVLRKPDWIRVKVPASSPQFAETRAILREHGLVTVCEEAGCPNIAECWAGRHATMMIMGDTCTRACAFCNVKTGLPGALDAREPENVAQAVAKLGLDHIVITSVDRDDLADGGAAHFAATIRAIRALTPNDDHRGADARLPAQGRRAGDGRRRRRPTSTTTTSRRCPRSISRSGRARATSTRCACCSG